jgi:transcriptional regulator with XRE-family HTH domain
VNEQIQLIAERIRTLRQDAGLTAETCAREMGLTAEVYASYESGAADIPVSFLHRAAHRFQVELSALLTGEEPRLRVYAVTRAGQGMRVERRKDYQYQSLAPNFVDKRMEPFLITVDPHPDADPIPLNTHPGQEFDHLMQGTMKVLVGGHEIVLEAGDSVFFDSSFPHGMKSLHGKPARFLAVIL